MKKFAMVMMLSVFLLDGTSQIMGGFGQILTGTVGAIVSPAKTVASDTARWAGHYEYVEEGNDASGMSVTG